MRRWRKPHRTMLDRRRSCVLSDFPVFGLLPLSRLQWSYYSLSGPTTWTGSSNALFAGWPRKENMSQAQPFEFRSPHRIRKIESDTRSWNGITVRNILHYPDPGKAWHDLSSRETTVAIVLGQVGGYCEPRLNLNRPTLRSRFDAGHTTFVPADMTEGMSLEEMATLVGLAQSQFARSFKLSTGMPPYKWSLDARIKRAQELLLLGKESIAFIALQTGFADQSHFTKTFRRATGVTPKDRQRPR